MTNLQDKGLGAFFAYDPLAENYLMREVMAGTPMVEVPESIEYKPGPVLDQGSEGACVGMGWTAWRNCEPVVPETPYREDYAIDVYRRATEVDEWPQHNWKNSGGTSNQAGAKIMREEDALEAFVWAKNPSDMRVWLLTKGPVVFTCQWRSNMYRTDEHGFIQPTGAVRGAHCLFCYGIDAQGNYLVQNSWGEDYGIGGFAKMTPATMDMLYSLGSSWSACSAVEKGELAPIDKRAGFWASIRKQIEVEYGAA